jgi:hypothetical protein
MSSWDDLTQELDVWQRAGKQAEFWWRDDDAVTTTPALERLLELRQKTGCGLALAVIPARADDALARRLADEPDVVVAQHGWAHINHAPPGRPKSELGPDRLPAYVLGELGRGWLALDRLFGADWLKIIVPPHNRIAPPVAAGLAAAGYAGLSTDKPRRGSPPGLALVNTHIDIMEWTATRAFLGEGQCLAQAIAHLRAKRIGDADPEEPTGLLTHHLAHDPPAWAFVERFFAHTAAHPAILWRHPRELFRRKPAAVSA